MNRNLTEIGFVIYDKRFEKFFSGCLNWGRFHGLTKNIANANFYDSEAKAREFIGHILKNIDDLNRDFGRGIRGYSHDDFEIFGCKREINIFVHKE